MPSTGMSLGRQVKSLQTSPPGGTEIFSAKIEQVFIHRRVLRFDQLSFFSPVAEGPKRGQLSIRRERAWRHFAPSHARSAVDDQLDVLGKTARDFGDDIALEERYQFISVRRTEHENVDAQCG